MESNNKRIAKNTAYLYVRMLLNMAITFYTSRVVLNTLGVDDFGTYGVVGGIIAMFGFLNSSMAGATSRFLTFELGRQNYERLKKTFSAALTMHFIIALLILVFGETAGLWWLENKLIIAPDRMNAARWVFHLSILASIIGITQAPYNATIIAHERMNVYAYVEILHSLLKLGIVFLLVIGNFDKLILYAVLTLCVTLIITTIYKIYCTRNFAESHYKFHWDKEIITPMLSFSGWDLYGNMSVIGRTQGVNMLLNMFFGPVLNAANAVAIHVQTAMLSFAGNIMTAVRPQIVKSYAAQNYQYTIKLVLNTTKYIYLLLLILSLPLILEMDFVLTLWLKNVPSYAAVFCRCTLIFLFFSTMSNILVSTIHATGNIKRPSIINGTLYLLVLPVTYVAFKWGGIPIIPYICNILFVFIGMMSNAYTLKSYVAQFSIKDFIYKVLCVCLFITVLSFSISMSVKYNMPEGFLRFILIILVSTVSTSLLTYFIAMDKQTKYKIKQKTFVLLHRK
jgi:O-antigen/teichoic acid export membrane protein